jgi:hypothetical protein
MACPIGNMLEEIIFGAQPIDNLRTMLRENAIIKVVTKNSFARFLRELSQVIRRGARQKMGAHKVVLVNK